MKFFQKSTNPLNNYFRKSLGGGAFFNKSHNKTRKGHHANHDEKEKVKHSPLERHHTQG